MSQEVKVCVVGVGWVGIRQGRAIANNPRAGITALCDVSEKRMKRFEEELGKDVKLYTDYKEMVQDPDIDAVFVGTPNDTHSSIGIKAIQEGKHVLMTKPLADSEEAAKKLVKEAEGKDVVNMMSLNIRFNDSCIYLKNLVNDGYFGDIYYARAWYIRRNGIPTGYSKDQDASSGQKMIQKGGGALRDIGVHVLDAAWALLGTPDPEFILGISGAEFGPRGEKYWGEPRPSDFETHDYGSGFIKFTNGKGIQLDSFWSSHHPEEKQIEIFGTKAGGKINPLTIFKGEHEADQNIDVKIREERNPFERIADHFIECILDEKECKAPFRHGYVVQRMLEAILESSEKGEPIYLDE
ncbi:oxidoreductase [candidate division MSBL1 archaeon SCGC-AAA259E19]|uniref:Oxidoreductase n=1 Tax=candidate division MSBL1 archaeon SCGC-AAA259E19 TaxID=1698264 RepID=A0A133UNN2_9EURY|nr:oxidoreductase [candidate division MSBL1 archaeon SCGC-AAA259E19]